MTIPRKLCATIVATLLGQQAYAAGFSLDVHSVNNVATAYAGQATGVHDVSDMFINPAVLGELDGGQLNVGASYIFADAKIKGGATGTAPSGGDADFLGDGSKGENGGEDALVPAFHIGMPITEQLSFGLGVTVPWGLETKYDDNWIGRYYAVESRVESTNLHPALSYKINDTFTVAVGAQVQYLEAFLSKAVDASLLFPGPPAASPATDLLAEVEGDDWGYGYTLGLMAKPSDKLKVGFGYRSKVAHTLKGDLEVGGSKVDAKARITTPEMITLGASYVVSDDFTIFADAHWTHWGRFKHLNVEAGGAVDSTQFNSENSWRYSVGGQYRVNDSWLVRGGVSHEQSSLNDDYFSPSIPIPDKTVIAVGASYGLNEALALDFGLMYEFFEDGESKLSDPAKGTLNADYDVDAAVLVVGLTYDL